MVNGIHSPVEERVKALGCQDVAWMAVALTAEASTGICFIYISNRLSARRRIANTGMSQVSERMRGGLGCPAETDWQKRTKRSDFVLTVRLSVVQGLALRLGLSNDIPNELNPDFGCCDSDRYPNGTRQSGCFAGLAWVEE